ncbi:MAG TPA: response regulator [Chryseolinea sp.]|nr:response regulator [Chryseolinea sp.]
MTFDKKILVAFISCALVLAFVAFISFKNRGNYMEANQMVTHTHVVLYELEQILLTLTEAESGVRGYVISGNDNFVDRYNNSNRTLFDHIKNARRLTSDNSIQQGNIDFLERTVRLRVEKLEECIELVKGGEIGKAQQLISTGTGKQLQDEVASVIDGAKQIEENLLVARNAASESDASSFNALFLSLLSVMAVVLCVVYLIIIRNIRALKRAEAEATEKNWNLAGSAELVKRMQGNKSVPELCQNIIDALTTYLDIPLGSLYVREGNSTHLKLQAAHAAAKSGKMEIQLHEGLVGQAAAGNIQILVDNIASESYDLTTSFGVIRPGSVLAVPISFEGKVGAVLEFGVTRTFSTAQRLFINNVSDSIAITINAAHSREEVKDLLQETQRQAEELEAQQHEIKQTNEQLLAKTELLEKSEAILKSQQEELLQSNMELEEKANMLEEQKGLLEHAKRGIEEKMHEIGLSSKYKSEFLANMSHELRTPLNSILILSQLLHENKQNRLSEKETDHARNIFRSGSDLLNLINEILDLSKIESGKMTLDLGHFTISEIIASLNSTFAEFGKRNAITFTVKCRIEHVVLHSDKQCIEQILKNLLSNAFKFTEAKGSVVLDIQDEGSGLIAFSVMDTGIGIPDSKKQVIFEAFQQADGSTKRKYGGTGLGLSISRELAIVLGGKIELQSVEGTGSTFTLRIPREFNPKAVQEIEKKVEMKATAPPYAVKHSVEPHAALEGNAFDDRNDILENDRIVLIIEDDEPFAQTLLSFIRERKYKGIIATQGAMGISYARHYRPDAILLDMKLPVMDGNEVLGHLKTDPDLRHIPVQIISGYDYQKTSLALGAFDYLRKPVQLPELHKAFDKIEKFTSRKLKKLLIIEDNDQQNNAIRELIGNGDVKTFSAYSGAQAQEMLLQEAFDCIIVDLGLPDMSGFDLLETIKADERLNMIPIIVYTGKDLKKEEANKLKRLSDTVVLKTVNSHERLLDETTLFLHRVESRLPKEKQLVIRKLHRTDEVLKDKVILLVDDDIRNVYSLSSALEEEGVACVIAENGKVAIEVLTVNPSINLVLMDIMMPEMDGYEATIEIRKMEQFKKLPIIALTAKAMKGDKEKCLSVGMSDYITKPVNIGQLLSLMRVWLYQHI